MGTGGAPVSQELAPHPIRRPSSPPWDSIPCPGVQGPRLEWGSAQRAQMLLGGTGLATRPPTVASIPERQATCIFQARGGQSQPPLQPCWAHAEGRDDCYYYYCCDLLGSRHRVLLESRSHCLLHGVSQKLRPGGDRLRAYYFFRMGEG